MLFFMHLPPSQNSVIKAYAECAEFLRLEISSKPDSTEYPQTAWEMLENYQALAQTYHITGPAYVSPQAAYNIQVKMDEIKTMRPRKAQAYKTEIKDKKLYPKIWDAVEFLGSVNLKKLRRGAPDYYKWMNEQLYDELCINVSEGHTIFEPAQQWKILQDQGKNMERFKSRMFQRGLAI